jgi:hypothetical protein
MLTMRCTGPAKYQREIFVFQPTKILTNLKVFESMSATPDLEIYHFYMVQNT